MTVPNTSILTQTNDTLFNITNTVNSASSGFLGYLIVIIIFVAATWYILRRTNDIAKSLLTAGFVTILPVIILFYWGKTHSMVLIPDILLYGLVVAVSLGAAGVKYMRREQ